MKIYIGGEHLLDTKRCSMKPNSIDSIDKLVLWRDQKKEEAILFLFPPYSILKNLTFELFSHLLHGRLYIMGPIELQLLILGNKIEILIIS